MLQTLVAHTFKSCETLEKAALSDGQDGDISITTPSTKVQIIRKVIKLEKELHFITSGFEGALPDAEFSICWGLEREIGRLRSLVPVELFSSIESTLMREGGRA